MLAFSGFVENDLCGRELAAGGDGELDLFTLFFVTRLVRFLFGSSGSDLCFDPLLLRTSTVNSFVSLALCLPCSHASSVISTPDIFQLLYSGFLSSSRKSSNAGRFAKSDNTSDEGSERRGGGFWSAIKE